MPVEHNRLHAHGLHVLWQIRAVRLCVWSCGVTLSIRRAYRACVFRFTFFSSYRAVAVSCPPGHAQPRARIVLHVLRSFFKLRSLYAMRFGQLGTAVQGLVFVWFDFPDLIDYLKSPTQRLLASSVVCKHCGQSVDLRTPQSDEPDDLTRYTACTNVDCPVPDDRGSHYRANSFFEPFVYIDIRALALIVHAYAQRASPKKVATTWFVGGPSTTQIRGVYRAIREKISIGHRASFFGPNGRRLGGTVPSTEPPDTRVGSTVLTAANQHGRGNPPTAVNSIPVAFDEGKYELHLYATCYGT